MQVKKSSIFQFNHKIFAYYRLSLIESIPDGLIYPNNSIKTPSTFDTWLNLINLAEKSIEIASLYWTLRRFEIYPDPTSIKVTNYVKKPNLDIELVCL